MSSLHWLNLITFVEVPRRWGTSRTSDEERDYESIIYYVMFIFLVEERE